MATRSIVTSQPDVACDVCGRRLLRGEHPDTFLAGREPRTVCELCVPRATQEGWLRESQGEALSVRPPRGRRGVSLLDRLRQLREPVQRRALSTVDRPLNAHVEVLEESLDFERELYLGAVPVERPGGSAVEGADEPGLPVERPAVDGDPRLARVLEVFNVGEQPRRVAGVARSLGAPSVSAQPIDGSDTRFTIVVAWELCWYRYEVDLEDEPAGARLLEKGMELDELPAEERLENVLADEHGELHPVG